MTQTVQQTKNVVSSNRKAAQSKTKEYNIIAEINERYAIASQYWSPIFNRVNSDKRFLNGDQWTKAVETQRNLDGRPCVTIPRLSNFVRQLQTQIRQNNSTIEISANDNASEIDVAIMNGLIKKILNKSDSNTTFDNIGYDAIVGGIGALRIYSDYPNYATFDEQLFIEHIYDPTSVYFDPSSTDYLFSDSRYVFIETVMSKDEYFAKFGKGSKISDASKVRGWSSSVSPLINDSNTIIILEYYWIEDTSKSIYKLGNIITGETAISEEKPTEDMVDWIVVETRKIPSKIVKHCVFDGVEMHNETIIEGTDIIPVIPCLGEQTFIDRKRYIKGAIHDAIDTQRILNYTASTQLELIDLSPRSPWLVTPDAIEGYENEWNDANVRNFSYLMYNGKAPAPVRMPANVDVGPVAAIKQQAEADLQAVFGIFDAALGANAQETSGVAIKTRVDQSNQSTFIYKDNLIKSIRQVGVLLTKMIPSVYNGRTETIPMVDGNDVKAKININPLSSFEVAVVSQPDNASQKEILNSELMKIATALPQAAPLVADYIIKNSELPGSEQLVARLATLLPPEVRAIEAANKQQDPAQAQALLMQKTQEAQQLNAAMQQIQMQMQQLQLENQQLKADKSLEQKKIELNAIDSQRDYEIKSKELMLEKTKLELDWQLSSQQQKLAEAKLTSEMVGGQHDQIPNVNV